MGRHKSSRRLTALAPPRFHRFSPVHRSVRHADRCPPVAVTWLSEAGLLPSRSSHPLKLRLARAGRLCFSRPPIRAVVSLCQRRMTCPDETNINPLSTGPSPTPLARIFESAAATGTYESIFKMSTLVRNRTCTRRSSSMGLRSMPPAGNRELFSYCLILGTWPEAGHNAERQRRLNRLEESSHRHMAFWGVIFFFSSFFLGSPVLLAWLGLVWAMDQFIRSMRGSPGDRGHTPAKQDPRSRRRHGRRR